MKRFEIITLVVGVIVLIMLGIAGSYLQKLLLQDNQADLVKFPEKSGCDLSKTRCSSEFSNRKISIDFTRPVKYLEKFDITVNLAGFSPNQKRRVFVDFSMTDMNMGINRFELSAENKNGNWQGFGILPVCISGRRDWLVKVYVEDDGHQYQASFRLLLEP